MGCEATQRCEAICIQLVVFQVRATYRARDLLARNSVVVHRRIVVGAPQSREQIQIDIGWFQESQCPRRSRSVAAYVLQELKVAVYLVHGELVCWRLERHRRSAVSNPSPKLL